MVYGAAPAATGARGSADLVSLGGVPCWRESTSNITRISIDQRVGRRGLGDVVTWQQGFMDA